MTGSRSWLDTLVATALFTAATNGQCPTGITPTVANLTVQTGASVSAQFTLALSTGSQVPIGAWSIIPTWPGLTGTITASGLATVNVAPSVASGYTYSAHIHWIGSCGGTSYNLTAFMNFLVTGTGLPVNAYPVSGVAPLSVAIGTTVSVASPTYFWFYGDGASDFTFTPVSSHVYSAPGQFQTTLWVTSAGQNLTVYQGPIISVSPPPLTVSAVLPPFVDVTGGDLLDITGSGFLPGAPNVMLGQSPATAVMVLSTSLIRCTAPPGSIGQATVSVQYPWATAAAASPVTYVPVITQVIPATVSGSAPTTLLIDCQGVGSASALLVNGVTVSAVPTATGLQATLDPSLWQAVGAAALQVTASGTAGPSSHPFIVPGTTVLGNVGWCGGSPLGAMAGVPGWVDVGGVPPGAPVTLVADDSLTPMFFSWPGGAQFAIGVGGPGLSVVFDGVGLFGSAMPAFVANTNGMAGSTVIVPSIAFGSVVRLQAVYSDPSSATGYGVTWITSFAF